MNHLTFFLVDLSCLRVSRESGASCLMPRGTLAVLSSLLSDAAVLALLLFGDPLAV